MDDELTKEQAEQVERDHDVYVDAESGQYHTTGPDEDFGWRIIPEG